MCAYMMGGGAKSKNKQNLMVSARKLQIPFHKTSKLKSLCSVTTVLAVVCQEEVGQTRMVSIP